MMSRITLNLKKSVRKVKDTVVRPELPSMFTQRSQLDVTPGIKIVAPGFNQTSTVDSIDFGVPVPMSNLSRAANGNGGSYKNGGKGLKAITIASPKQMRLSTISQESSQWDRSNSTRSDQERTRESARDPSSPSHTHTYGSIGLQTIDETSWRPPS